MLACPIFFYYAAKSYFEYKDAKSKKFWEVSVSGKKVNIRYGKLGTDGLTSVKELSTSAEAIRR
jgi:predicted DNA-binding WGR domain protein